jgi:hypothetical protein
MTGPLTRAKDWLIAPPDEAPESAPPPTAGPPDDPPERPTRWLAPVPSTQLDDHRTRPPAHGRRRTAPAAPQTTPEASRNGADPIPWVAAGDRRPAASDWVAVLGDARDVPALAAGLALALRRRRRTPAAIVAVWPHEDDSAGSPAIAAPAWPAARLLAGRLARRGLVGRAHGRLVWLALGADAHVPVPAAAPAVLAVIAARDAAVDAVVARCASAVVAAEPGSPLAALALGELEGLGVVARAVAPPPAGVARLAALAGLRALPFGDDEGGA